ncbi:MAG TPA: UDP-N-acetylmuramoyl-tripeptide--D-alanyl-D-alanine ligase [Actinotalea sp.]|nr:UDP-N-acetylmuramoyl-tripeptide--D-alanyl-D-alanine ligase [Gemmatimonadales bacterium]HMO10897.1 UDP-N-acetylmuramoyl-tripeptide--D-alanyl-D-alanine ligase [Actinotalea sp.]
MRWDDRAVRTALGLPGGAEGPAYTAIVTDTRTLAPGALFVALAGERFDGHRFLDVARDAGAIAAVVRADTADVPGLILYRVEDTLRAYGWLARHRRRQLRGPVVGVTGTNGKTATKEMLAAALATRFRVHATRLNLNNLVGVPQTILEAPESIEALVVEAGANLPGEIARYREIIEPSVAVITNVAQGHLEGFGSVEGVRAEKLALAEGVPVVVIPSDDAELLAGARARAGRVVTAGLERGDVVPTSVTLDPAGRARMIVDGIELRVSQFGLHQARNALLVWAVAKELGLDLAAVASALGQVSLPGGRGELIQHGSLTVLNDSYNANPASFRAVIEVARAMRGNRKLVFVAGTMRELGPEASRWHADVAEALVALDPDLLAAVGEFGPALAPFAGRLGERLLTAPDALSMGEQLAPRLKGDELVVLKGSRGVTLERMLPALIARTAP